MVLKETMQEEALLRRAKRHAKAKDSYEESSNEGAESFKELSNSETSSHP